MDDYAEISKLSQFAFQYKLDTEAYEKKRKQEADLAVYGYLLDGKLAGKLHILPLEVIINGKIIEMGGIASVATWPEYRRQGIAKKLIYHALEELDEKDVTLSYLHPFHVQFYRKLGWELSFDHYHLDIPMRSLKEAYPTVDGHVERTKGKMDIVKAIYVQYAKQYNGMLHRSNHWWEHRVLHDETWHITIAYNDEEEAEAYVIYKVEENVLHIRDLAYVNMHGKKLLLAFIANHDSMAEMVKMTVPTNDLLRFTLANPRMKNTIEPYFMARIVNVEKFLRQYPFAASDFHIGIKVSDTFYRVNNGVYQLTQTDSHIDVVKDEKGTIHLDCSIQQLTAMVLGYQCPLTLLANEYIVGDREKIEQFKEALHTKQTFLPDYF